MTAAHRATFGAFLDQGRWLLGEQQRRGASFQANAVALLGFDGIVLGILATGDFLVADDFWSFRSVAGRLAVLLLAVSALCAVRVISPRGAGSVVIDDTLDGWEGVYRAPSAGERPFEAEQQFAHMLLARDPVPATPGPAARRWRSRRTDGKQVLHDAARLAEFRSDWTRYSGWLLLAALTALVILMSTTAENEPPGDGRK